LGNLHEQNGNDNNGDVLHYSVRSFDREYQLRLVRATDLFHKDYEEILIGANGQVLERRNGNNVETSCYYRGHVLGIEGSSVTISTCNKLNDRSRQPLHSSTLTATNTLSSRFGRFQSQQQQQQEQDEDVVSLTGVIMLPDTSPLYIEPAHEHVHGLQSCNYTHCRLPHPSSFAVVEWLSAQT
jgi:hypothetical protein